MDIKHGNGMVSRIYNDHITIQSVLVFGSDEALDEFIRYKYISMMDKQDLR